MKNELIRITEHNGEQAVSAKDLYEFLGFDKSQWKRWYTKNIENNDFAIEKQDWEGFDMMSSSNNGAKTKDFTLSLDFAKRLSMMARTAKGEELRNYFIQCEKTALSFHTRELSRKELLQMALEAEEQKEHLQAQLTLQQPKVVFADAVSASKTCVLVGELAKILKQNGIDMGQNRLFDWLRGTGYLISRQGTDYNMPTQKSMNLGLFEIKETSIAHSDGHTSISKTPKVTGKGQVYFINKFINQRLSA